MNRVMVDRLGPIARAMLLSGLLMLALLLGIAGGMYGFEFQLLLVIVLVPAALLMLNERIAVVLLVLMLPYSDAKVWFLPRVLQNAVILGLPTLFFARVALRLAAGKSLQFAPPRELMLYVGLMVLGVAIGYTHLGEINPMVEASIAQDGSYGFKEYVIGFFAKSMALVVMAVMVASAVAERGRGEWVLKLAFGSGVLIVGAMLAILVAYGVPLTELRNNRNVFDLLGRQSNQLGSLLALLLAVSLFVRETAVGVRARLAMTGVVVVLVVGVLLTASRGAFVALLAAFVVYVLTFRRIRTALAAVAIVVGGVMAAPESVQERLTQGIGERYGVSTAAGDRLSSGRFDIWAQLAPDVLLHPVFGNGLKSTLWSNYNRYGRNLVVNSPHSGYLGLLLDSGLVGLVFVFVLFRYAWLTFRSLARDPRVTGAMHGAFLAGPALICAFLAFNFAGGDFFPSTGQTFFWLFFGLAMGYRTWLGDPPTLPAAKGAPRRRVRLFRH